MWKMLQKRADASTKFEFGAMGFDATALLNAILLLPIGAFLALALTPKTKQSSVFFIELIVPWQRPPPEIINPLASYYILGILLIFAFSLAGAIYKPFKLAKIPANYILPCIVYFTILIALYSVICNFLIYRQEHSWLAWLGMFGYLLFLIVFKRRLDTQKQGTKAYFIESSDRKNTISLRSLNYFDFFVFLLITSLVLPNSISDLVNMWDITNAHVVSYLIGPALLATIDGSLPNVSFFSQYSIGLPYLFRWLLSNDLTQVIRAYLVSVTAAVAIYCILFYYFSSRIYISRLWGLVFTLIMMVFLSNALYWSEPSSSPLRFLFFPIFCILVFRLGMNGFWPLVFAGTLTAVAILHNVETGIITAVSVLALLMVISRSWYRLLLNTVWFILSTLFVFYLVCVALYGFNSLSFNFLIGNLKPLFAYSFTGFGNYPLPWHPKHWVWFQALVLPGIAILTIVMLYYQSWTGRELSKREQSVFFCCAFGLLLMVKFMNRSFLAIGHLNSGPLILIFGFVFVSILRLMISRNAYLLLRMSLVHSFALVALLLTFCLFIATFRENSPHDVRFANTWITYPSIFSRLFGASTLTGTTLVDRVSKITPKEDVDLIKRNSPIPSEPVWIFGNNDWMYLLLADRKPGSAVLPMPYVLLSQDLTTIRESFARRNPEVFFVEKDEMMPQFMGRAHDNLLNYFPDFDKKYQAAEVGINLYMYRRLPD